MLLSIRIARPTFFQILYLDLCGKQRGGMLLERGLDTTQFVPGGDHPLLRLGRCASSSPRSASSAASADAVARAHSVATSSPAAAPRSTRTVEVR